MSDWKPRVFWKEAFAAQVEGGWTVHLDGRSIKTPAKAALIVPTRAMAEAMAVEWAAQVDTVAPETMPVTRAANSAIDKVVPQFDEVAEIVAAYGDSDLLCYRATDPIELTKRQADHWDPLLEWSEMALQAPLTPVSGVIHKPQAATSVAQLTKAVRAMTAFELAALHDLVALSGSLVIGLAAAANYRPIDALWDISRVDENWQIEMWGADEEAEALALRKKQDFLQAHQFLALSKQS